MSARWGLNHFARLFGAPAPPPCFASLANNSDRQAQHITIELRMNSITIQYKFPEGDKSSMLASSAFEGWSSQRWEIEAFSLCQLPVPLHLRVIDDGARGFGGAPEFSVDLALFTLATNAAPKQLFAPSTDCSGPQAQRSGLV